MSHGIGVVETVKAVVPDAVVVAAALLTQLGDTWFLLVLLATLYLFGAHTPGLDDGPDRRDMATVLALAIGAVALTIGTKALFVHPRPPGADSPAGAGALPASLRGGYAWLASAGGFALPSGHALLSTTVYGGLAWVFPRGTRRHRVGISVVLVGLIAATRVVLGVHYIGDVLLGIVLGVVLLGLGFLVARGRPGRAFTIAAGLAVVALVPARYAVVALTILGGAIGGGLAWATVGEAIPPQPSPGRETTVLAVVGIPLVVALAVLTVTVVDAYRASARLAASAFIAGTVTVGVLVSLPAVSAPVGQGRRPRGRGGEP